MQVLGNRVQDLQRLSFSGIHLSLFLSVFKSDYNLMLYQVGTLGDITPFFVKNVNVLYQYWFHV